MQQLCTEMQVIATNLQDPNKLGQVFLENFVFKCEFRKKKISKILESTGLKKQKNPSLYGRITVKKSHVRRRHSLLVEVDLIKSTETCQCTLNQGLHLLVSY
jgi:hypothetical protein